MPGKQKGVRRSVPELELNQYEQVFVVELLRGKTAKAAIAVVRERFPEFQLCDRSAQLWAKKPHIKRILEASRQQQTTVISQWQIERTKSVLPKFTDEMLEILDEGVKNWKLGFQEMRRILEDDEASDRSKIEAFRHITTAVKEVANLSGVLQTEKVLHGQERANSQQGLTPEFGQFLREHFLGVQTISPPQQIEPEFGLP